MKGRTFATKQECAGFAMTRRMFFKIMVKVMIVHLGVRRRKEGTHVQKVLVSRTVGFVFLIRM